MIATIVLKCSDVRLEMFRCKVCMVEGCFLVEEHRSLFEIFSFMFVRLVNVLRVL